ncbi:MAG: anthranilate phosphoribosyltransferase [Planctomycetes bacterium]|nr:anthranilate phosphoribosyltransferase [Planctomycetota bacterium]
MIQEAIRRLLEGRSLSAEEAAASMTEIMEGLASEAQIAGFLVALRMKGETVEEILGCARVMRSKVTRVRAGPGPVVDTCGTGGDGSHSFNVSTAAALIAAGAGATVAKHGNRSVSSRSGSADVLEALGVNVEASVPVVERCLAEARVGFLFAPRLHAAMKFAAKPRRDLGVRTVFNLLGPLTNPADARHQLLGVHDARWTEPLARVLLGLGSAHALVVHGLDGLDEISTTGPSRVSECRGDSVVTYEVRPEHFGLSPARIENFRVVDAQASAESIRAILDGTPGPRADIALLNAGAALYAADAAESLEEGLALARESVRSGRARHALERLAECSRIDAGLPGARMTPPSG